MDRQLGIRDSAATLSEVVVADAEYESDATTPSGGPNHLVPSSLDHKVLLTLTFYTKFEFCCILCGVLFLLITTNIQICNPIFKYGRSVMDGSNGLVKFYFSELQF